MSIRTYEYELLPSEAQRAELVCNAGSYRFVFNRTLEYQRGRLVAGEALCSRSRLMTALSLWKKDPQTTFLKICVAAFLTSAVGQADAAVRKAVARKPGDPFSHWPDFMRKALGDDIPCLLSVVTVAEDEQRLRLPKLGWLSWRQRRPMAAGQIEGVMLRRRKDDRWFVVIRKRVDD